MDSKNGIEARSSSPLDGYNTLTINDFLYTNYSGKVNDSGDNPLRRLPFVFDRL
jgi:hypothetical protein